MPIFVLHMHSLNFLLSNFIEDMYSIIMACGRKIICIQTITGLTLICRVYLNAVSSLNAFQAAARSERPALRGVPEPEASGGDHEAVPVNR